MKKQILALAAGAALLTAASSSFAATFTASPAVVGNLGYSAVLTAGCEASLTQPAVPFVNQTTYAGDALNKSAGSVSVKCSNMAYKVCFNAGTKPTAAIDANRRLDGVAPLVPGTDMLSYTLKATGGILGATATLVGDKNCVGTGGYTATNPTADNGISDNGDGTNTIIYSLTADVTIPTNSKPGTYNDAVAVNIVW